MIGALAEISTGGFCRVCRCEHLETGSQVAVKTVIVAQEGNISGIRREIRALARLSHPDVVRVLDDGVAYGAPWYAMELVSDATLSNYCQGLTAHPTSRLISNVRSAYASFEDAPPYLLPADPPMPDRSLVAPLSRRS